MSEAGPPAALPPLAGGALAVTSIALALGTFMQVLDGTIANVSVPTIAGNMGVSASQGTWVITSFAVSNSISVPLTGWLMGRYGVVRTFVASIALFTLASVLCGLAWSLPSLIFFRIVQGAVSGPMIPGSQALLISIFPASRRGTALAIWSMTTLVAPVCGPIVGGFICDNYTWPWIFLINVPVGILCAFLCWRGMAGRETPTRKLPIDRAGFMLLALWVGAFQVVLDTGKDADWFSSPAIVIEALVAGVGAVAWVIWELTEAHPIVDLSLFRSRNFALGTVVTCLGFALFFGSMVLQPLWLQTQMGYIATWAGLVAAPSGVVAIVLSPLAARIMSRIDARWTATVAVAALALSFYMRSLFTTDVNFGGLVMPMLVQGVAMSFLFVSMITITLNGVPPSQMPQATGLSNFARLSAGAFAASLSTTIWDRGEAVHQTRLAEIAGGANPALAATLRTLHDAGLSATQSAAAIGQMFSRQAYLLSTLDYFRVSAILMILLVPFVWLTRGTRGGGGVAAVE